MPYVNVRVAGTLTPAQKEQIAERITQVLFEVAHKPKESVLIFIDEVLHENISRGGKPLTKPVP